MDEQLKEKIQKLPPEIFKCYLKQEFGGGQEVKK